MGCEKCQTALYDCKCKDLLERVEELVASGMFIIPPALLARYRAQGRLNKNESSNIIELEGTH